MRDKLKKHDEGNDQKYGEMLKFFGFLVEYKNKFIF